MKTNQRMSILSVIIGFLLGWSILLGLPTAANGRGIHRKIQIVNRSKSRMEVFWVHPDTKETVLMSNPDVVPGADFPLDSFVGHTFEIREKPGKNGLCGASKKKISSAEENDGPSVCRRAVFSVSENEEQLATVNEDFEVEFVDNKVKARQEASELITSCQSAAKKRLAAAGSDIREAEAAIDDLVACVEGGVANTLVRVNEEIAFQSTVRKDIAGALENYTCMDSSLNSTDDLEVRTWFNPKERIRRTVHVKFERPAARIHVIENFINPDECEAMEKSAAKTLHRATVADGKGGSQLSQNRKAMQAGITVPWDKETSGDPIARLSRRVYDYTNHVLRLGIEEHGQEDLMSIQYFGRGENDTEPDRYTPHCDGDCTGLPHKWGTRMATMVMYCDVADKGGHTNFRNAGVHVKPTPGSGIFFSYIDPDTKLMDTGFTEHSGCPVFVGEKKIVTQWIRMGVDEQNPWNSFNTLGVKLSELEEGHNVEEDDGNVEEVEELNEGDDEEAEDQDKEL